LPTICGAALSARQIALAALCRWRSEGRFADPIISEFLAKAELTQSDRAFALELSYGSTCSLEPEENEEAVRCVLADLSILRLGRREVFASVWRSF